MRRGGELRRFRQTYRGLGQASQPGNRTPGLAPQISGSLSILFYLYACLLTLLPLPPVFLPGGDAAAEVALRPVFVQHRFHLQIQSAVQTGEPVMQILVNRAFADTELPGRRPDGSPMLRHPRPFLQGTFLYLLIQRQQLPTTMEAGASC